MDKYELVSIIQSNLDNAIGGDQGELSNERQDLLDRYYGELYGDEIKGQSSITTREVFETVEWAMPAIVEVFESSERICVFDPEGPEDEQSAEQETDAVNQIYSKDNNGFLTTSMLVKSALLNPNSYVKIWKDETEEVTTDQYTGLNEVEMTLLLSNQRPGEEIEVTGWEQKDGLYDIEVKTTCKRGKFRVDCLPEDEVLIHHRHTELSLDDCLFVAHQATEIHSDLLQRGYDEDLLDMSWSKETVNQEVRNRLTYSDERDESYEDSKALREYTVNECYMLVDWDGDGIAERRRVVMIGGEIFENEEMNYQPICSAASILMPHKHTGYSLAQSVKYLQKVFTFVWRQTMTNMSKANNPRKVVTKGANLSDVLSHSDVIRVKQAGDVTMEPIAPIIGQVVPLIDLLNQVKESRTGVTRNSMGLDADILAKSTEGAFMGAIEKADQRIAFIVRTFAETIFREMFLKLHRLINLHGERKMMKLNGQWVPVNPSSWKRRETMTVNIGMATANKATKVQAAQMIIAEQDKAIQMGEPNAFDPQQRYNARRLLVESIGETTVDKYFMNPAMMPPPQPQPPQPDPNMMLIQMQGQDMQNKHQRELMKMQQDAQKEQNRLQAEQFVNQVKFQFEAQKLQMEERGRQRDEAYRNQIDLLKLELEQQKTEDKAGAETLKARIQQLEIQLDDQQKDDDQKLAKYKTDMDNQTKVLLKEMEIGASQDSDAAKYAINALQQTIEDMKVEANSPKEIVYDETGRAIGVRNLTTGEQKSIVRDPSTDLPIGLK